MFTNSIKDKIERMELIDKNFADMKNKIKEQNNIDDTIKYFDESLKILDEYLKVKKELKSILADKSVFEISDEDLREKTRNILLNKQIFIADKILNDIIPGHLSVNGLTDEERDQLGSDLITSWISPDEMAESLYETRPLISGTSVPDDLKNFIDEGRKCLAFQQYNAVYSLCRTMLETAMCDVCIRMGKIKKPKKDSREFYTNYPPRKMINWVSEGSSRENIHDFYTELSALIHGYKTIEKTEAKETLTKTIGIIEELYNNNQNKFDGPVKSPKMAIFAKSVPIISISYKAVFRVFRLFTSSSNLTIA